MSPPFPPFRPWIARGIKSSPPQQQNTPLTIRSIRPTVNYNWVKPARFNNSSIGQAALNIALLTSIVAASPFVNSNQVQAYAIKSASVQPYYYNQALLNQPITQPIINVNSQSSVSIKSLPSQQYYNQALLNPPAVLTTPFNNVSYQQSVGIKSALTQQIQNLILLNLPIAQLPFNNVLFAASNLRPNNYFDYNNYYNLSLYQLASPIVNYEWGKASQSKSINFDYNNYYNQNLLSPIASNNNPIVNYDWSNRLNVRQSNNQAYGLNLNIVQTVNTDFPFISYNWNNSYTSKFSYFDYNNCYNQSLLNPVIPPIPPVAQSFASSATSGSGGFDAYKRKKTKEELSELAAIERSKIPITLAKSIHEHEIVFVKSEIPVVETDKPSAPTPVKFTVDIKPISRYDRSKWTTPDVVKPIVAKPKPSVKTIEPKIIETKPKSVILKSFSELKAVSKSKIVVKEVAKVETGITDDEVHQMLIIIQDYI